MYHAGRCQIGRTISLMDNKRSSWRIIKGTQQHRVFKILGVRKPIFPTCHCFEVSTSATCAHVQIAEPKANVAEDSLPLEHRESTPQRSSGHSQPILKTSEDRSRSEAPLYLLSAVQASIQRNSGPLRSKMQNEFFQFGQFTPAMTRDLEDCSLTVDAGQIQSFQVSPSGICSWLCSVSSNQLCTKPSDQT